MHSSGRSQHRLIADFSATRIQPHMMVCAICTMQIIITMIWRTCARIVTVVLHGTAKRFINNSHKAHNEDVCGGFTTKCVDQSAHLNNE